MGDEAFHDGITNGADWYSLYGGMQACDMLLSNDITSYLSQDYNYLHSDCFEITLELSCCKYPAESSLYTEWQNNKESLLAYIEQVHIGVKGLVTDSRTHKPIPNAVVSGARRCNAF